MENGVPGGPLGLNRGASGAELGSPWTQLGGLGWVFAGLRGPSWHFSALALRGPAGSLGLPPGPLVAPGSCWPLGSSLGLWHHLADPGGSLGIWRVLAAPGAFDGSYRQLAPGGLGGSLLGPQTVTVKTLVENRVENGVEIYLTYVFEEYEE